MRFDLIRRGEFGARKTSQPVECHEFNPPKPCEKSGHSGTCFNPGAEEVDTGGSPASLAYSGSSMSSEAPCLKEGVKVGPGLHVHVHLHMRVYPP